MSSQSSVNAVAPRRISVIIPTYRRFGCTLQTIAQVLRQDYPNFEVLVVDQNTEWPAECAQQKADLMKDARLVWMRHTPGVVAARNQAARQSDGEILLFLDDDVMLTDESFLARHAAKYELGDVAAVTGREVVCHNPTDEQVASLNANVAQYPSAWEQLPPRWSKRSGIYECLRFPRNSTTSAQVCTFCTCNASIRKDVFWSVGGFDECFRGNSYGDDYDLAVRLSDAGYHLTFAPDAGLIHLQAPAGGLRMSDPHDQRRREREIAVCSWVMLLRHGRSEVAWDLGFRHLLRKTVLRRTNLVRPWRQLLSIPILIGAYREARRIVRGLPAVPVGTA